MTAPKSCCIIIVPYLAYGILTYCVYNIKNEYNIIMYCKVYAQRDGYKFV